MTSRRFSKGRWTSVSCVCVSVCWALLAAPAFADKISELYELRMACESGERDACYMLGHAYETRDDLWGEPVRGELVKRDDSVAMRYFRKSCDMGEGKGCRRLGRMYEFGKGAAKDNVEALRFYLRACDRRDAQLCNELSELLER